MDSLPKEVDESVAYVFVCSRQHENIDGGLIAAAAGFTQDCYGLAIGSKIVFNMKSPLREDAAEAHSTGERFAAIMKENGVSQYQILDGFRVRYTNQAAVREHRMLPSKLYAFETALKSGLPEGG